MIEFPPIKPTERAYTTDKLPQTRARTENKRIVRRPLANTAGGGLLRLRFSAIPDTEAEDVRRVYRQTRSTYTSLILPEELFAGDPELEAFINGLGGEWRFAEAPVIQWIQRGFANMTVDLRHLTRQVLSLPAAFVPPLIPPSPPTSPGPGAIPQPPIEEIDPDFPEPVEGAGAYVMIDDWVDIAFNAFDPGVGALQPASSRAEPGPSLARLDNTGFIVSGTYGLREDALPRTLHTYIRSLNLDGTTSWTAAFELPNPQGGSINPPSMLARRASGGIVMGVRNDRREGTELVTVVRHSLLGCAEDGTAPTVLASFTGPWSGRFAKNVPSGYVFYGRQTSSNSANVIIATITEEFAVASTTAFASAFAPTDCCPDPSGSGRLFFCGNNRVFCLNADLSVSWARSFTSVTIDAIKVTTDGVVYIAGFDSGDAAFVLQLSATDGTVTSSYVTSTEGGAYPFSLILRPGGGCIINVETFNTPLLYGYSLYVGLSATLSVDFAIGVNAYGPELGELNYSYPFGVPALSANHMILGMLTEYGTRGNSCEGAGYLITSNVNVATTAPGLFGPDPKICTNDGTTTSAASYTNSSIALTPLSGATISSTASVLTTAAITVKSLVWGWTAPPTPPTLTGATPIVLGSITYSQSSVFAGLEAATPTTMQNATAAETLQTGTDFIAGNNWIQMDLGAKRLINNIIIGCDFTNTLAGTGLGTFYTEQARLLYSENGTNWFPVVTGPLGPFSSAIQTISGLNIAGRYIRLSNTADLVVATEFYATTNP